MDFSGEVLRLIQVKGSAELKMAYNVVLSDKCSNNRPRTFFSANLMSSLGLLGLLNRGLQIGN